MKRTTRIVTLGLLAVSALLGACRTPLDEHIHLIDIPSIKPVPRATPGDMELGARDIDMRDEDQAKENHADAGD